MDSKSKGYYGHQQKQEGEVRKEQTEIQIQLDNTRTMEDCFVCRIAQKSSTSTSPYLSANLLDHLWGGFPGTSTSLAIKRANTRGLEEWLGGIFGNAL